MSDCNRSSQSRLARFCSQIRLRLARLGRKRGRRVMRAEHLDDRLKREIGLDPAARPNPREEHYRRLLRCGYPLG